MSEKEEAFYHGKLKRQISQYVLTRGSAPSPEDIKKARAEIIKINPDKDFDVGKLFDRYLEEKGLPLPEIQKYQLFWDADLDQWEDTNEWLVDKLIPEASVGIWSGKRSSYKTFLVLQMAFSVVTGTPFLNFETRKGTVLYLDKENGVHIMKTRKNMIKKGMEIEEDCDVGFICFSTLRIDRTQDVKEIEKLVEKHSPALIIVDTLRRAITGDENDAGTISALFVDYLRPVAEKYGCTILLIHHDRKSSGHQNDEMEELRGSSDIANYADFILKNERKGRNLVLKQLKNRNSPEIPPINVKIETDEENFMRFSNGGEYEKHTKEEECAESIILWITKNNINEFATKEAVEVGREGGYNRQMVNQSLKLLEEKGSVRNSSYGKYEVLTQSYLQI